MKNIYNDIPGELPEELVELLAGGKDVKIERILSRGHCSSGDFWYDQEQSEFVLLLKGCASIRFEDAEKCVALGPGDYLNIESHRRHRVESTASDGETVWLAVFY